MPKNKNSNDFFVKAEIKNVHQIANTVLVICKW